MTISLLVFLELSEAHGDKVNKDDKTSKVNMADKVNKVAKPKKIVRPTYYFYENKAAKTGQDCANMVNGAEEIFSGNFKENQKFLRVIKPYI